jgi:hypothetical protein
LLREQGEADFVICWSAAKEIGLPYAHLSRICAMSVGETIGEETLSAWAAEMGGA